MCLVLGDNIFHGSDFLSNLQRAVDNVEQKGRATIFGFRVDDPQRYGVAELDASGRCIGIEEKPAQPKSNYAVVGLYFYPNSVVEVASEVKPSARGELEITSVNQRYLSEGKLCVELFKRGFAWFDTGTFDSLYEAGSYVETLEKRTGLKIACIEEIAFANGWMTAEQLRRRASLMNGNEYGSYLLSLTDSKN